MKEEYLHYIWQYGLFDLSDLKTTRGEPISILSIGQYNKNAGPDFLNAKIKIGNMVWAGNVELHVRSSDWIYHYHHKDHAYNNVILHVVLLDDKEILNANGSDFPTLSLSSRIDQAHYNRYKDLVTNRNRIPCQDQLFQVEEITINSTIERMAINRLERKTEEVLNELEMSNNDWSQVYFMMLAKHIGMKVNSQPFEMLARTLHLNLLSKHIDNPMQIEALLFGSAGMLNKEFKDEYPNALKKEFEFLRNKYNITPIAPSSWKFMRMRPSNFPTIRIAQLAAYLVKNEGLINLDFSHFNIGLLRNAFRIQINEYWDNRYQFEKPSVHKPKNFGKSSFYNIVINAVVPFLFAYGDYHKNEQLKEMSLDILSAIPSEKNSIIGYWKKIGVNSDNAFDSQSLLELRNEYCFQKKCLTCNIGVNLLKDAILND